MELPTKIRAATADDFVAFRNLVFSNEALCEIGREQNQPELVHLGEKYLKSIEKGELRRFFSVHVCVVCVCVCVCLRLLCILFQNPSYFWVPFCHSWDACSQTYAGEGSQLWVLEDEGKVVGSIGCIAHDGNEIELVRMYVDISCRRRGYGSLLVKHVKLHAASRNTVRLKLTTPSLNTGPIGFYGVMGFTLEKAWTSNVSGVGDVDLSTLSLTM